MTLGQALAAKVRLIVWCNRGDVVKGLAKIFAVPPQNEADRDML